MGKEFMSIPERHNVLLEICEEVLNLDAKEPVQSDDIIKNAAVFTDEFDQIRYEVAEIMQTILNVEGDVETADNVKSKLLRHVARGARLLMWIEINENRKSKYCEESS